MSVLNYNEKLSKIRNELKQYAIITESNDIIKKKYSFFKVNNISIYLYTAPFIIIFILLLLIKPSFITYESKDKENNVTLKYNIKSLLISTLILGIIIDIGIFVYHKKNTK